MSISVCKQTNFKLTVY